MRLKNDISVLGDEIKRLMDKQVNVPNKNFMMEHGNKSNDLDI